MKNKFIPYCLLGAIMIITPDLLDGITVIYPNPVYVQPVYVAPVTYYDPVAVAAGTMLGIGLVALIGANNYTFDHTCWLYFSNGVLVQWGRPEDWPKAADHIQEIRYR
jgi:hypothetical protein